MITSLDLPWGGRRGVQGEPGTGHSRRGGFRVPPAFLILTFTTLGGRRSAVVVPDLGPLLFEGVRSGTLETERSRPPAPGQAHFSINSRGAQSPDVQALSCPGFVWPLRGRCTQLPVLDQRRHSHPGQLSSRRSVRDHRGRVGRIIHQSPNMSGYMSLRARSSSIHPLSMPRRSAILRHALCTVFKGRSRSREKPIPCETDCLRSSMGRRA